MSPTLDQRREHWMTGAAGTDDFAPSLTNDGTAEVLMLGNPVRFPRRPEWSIPIAIAASYGQSRFR